MSYSFIDTTELQNIEQLLPEEALQFNGVWLDQAIPGFRTLTVAGRESVESEIKTNSIDAQDGALRKILCKRYSTESENDAKLDT